MEIDTGDSLPVAQSPYTLPLKHYEWVRQEIDKDKKAVLSAKALEAIYHTASRKVDIGEAVLGRLRNGTATRKGRSGRKRITLQMKKEVTDKRHGNTFNKWIKKLIEFLEDSRSSRKRTVEVRFSD